MAPSTANIARGQGMQECLFALAFRKLLPANGKFSAHITDKFPDVAWRKSDEPNGLARRDRQSVTVRREGSRLDHALVRELPFSGSRDIPNPSSRIVRCSHQCAAVRRENSCCNRAPMRERGAFLTGHHIPNSCRVVE